LPPVKSPIPASLLALGFAVLVAASSREGTALFACCAVLALAAWLLAAPHFFPLLRRSRWLLLSMLLMFGWLTPGTPLAGVPGASQEGLWLAAEYLARLTIALAAVALILNALAPAALVAGLRSLLAPLAMLNISRDRIAVRLALTLEEVEAARRGGDAAPGPGADRLSLPAAAPGLADLLLGVASAALLLAAWLA